jgi:putative addiction module component (TIGR02574 family)
MSKISIDQLKDLSVLERIQLAEELWDSIVDQPETLPLTEAQREEIQRRLDEHAADPASVIPWDEVRKQLRQRVV